MSKEDPKIKQFSIDARTVINLGRDSIKNPTTALLELVKNSYDADATTVEVEIGKNTIRVADNGVGMTEEQLDMNWLRIGYSEKRLKTTTAKTRRKTGEKGIGRLSTDRLGENLTLRTKSLKMPAVQLSVDWELFNVDGKDLAEIPVNISEAATIKLPESKKNTGTEIIISNLRQEWLPVDIEQIYSELTALISPFSAVKDFQIIFSNHLLDDLNGPVKSMYYEAAEIGIQASVNGKSQLVKYKITDRTGSRAIIHSKHIKWKQLSQRVDNSDIGFNKTLSCGQVTIDMLFFARTKSNPLLEEKGLTLAGLKTFLDKNIGIKIYRDHVSVKPYGYNNEPAGDWLGLAQRKERDPAGLLRATYKVSSHQIVGAVAIGRDANPQLRDGASREGLIENDAFYDLRALTLACVTLLEKHRHEGALKVQKNLNDKENKLGLIEEVETYEHDLESFQKNLEGLKGTIKSVSGSDDAKSLEQITAVIQKTVETKRRIEELLDNNRVLSGLATVGIASAVFGHETQSAVSLFRSAVSAAQSALSLKTADIKRALNQLKISLKYAKQVSSWGAFAMARVRKEKRTRQDKNIKETLEAVINEVADAFNAVDIHIDRELDEVNAQAFVMDIESIVLNLMTNAYSACSQMQRKREVRVELHEKISGSIKGFEIIVADSGPGVDTSITDMIWEPLFTTKKDKTGREDGTGLGLSIVKSTVEELGGTRTVTKDPKLKGAQFRIWLPLK